MRVIAGTARSLKLKTPEGMDTRPTQDRIKETLFNILQTIVPGAVFLDLFSGSGAIGIEALSRGANKCYFVENDAEAEHCIKDNVAFTHFTEQSVILKQDVFSALYSIPENEVDVIFMDPPYNKDYERKVLEILQKVSYVSEETLIIIEASLQTDFSYAEEMGYSLEREKKYKTNKHVFLKRR